MIIETDQERLTHSIIYADVYKNNKDIYEISSYRYDMNADDDSGVPVNVFPGKDACCARCGKKIYDAIPKIDDSELLAVFIEGRGGEPSLWFHAAMLDEFRCCPCLDCCVVDGKFIGLRSTLISSRGVS